MGIPWDGTGINCYGTGMGQINMSHGQPWATPDTGAEPVKPDPASLGGSLPGGYLPV